ncbi:Nitric oxide synthase, salivary gland [Nymphon striatum]|nr:Nitric oxide synthase, salivary gland [Nymphon striatum]
MNYDIVKKVSLLPRLEIDTATLQAATTLTETHLDFTRTIPDALVFFFSYFFLLHVFHISTSEKKDCEEFIKLANIIFQRENHKFVLLMSIFNTEIENKVRSFEYWCYSRIIKISWMEKVSNKTVLQLMGAEETLVKSLKQRKMRFAGHVLRGSSGRQYRKKNPVCCLISKQQTVIEEKPKFADPQVRRHETMSKVPKHNTSKVLKLSHGSHDPDQVVTLQEQKKTRTMAGIKRTWCESGRIPACTLREAFTKYVDLSRPPPTQLLKFFQELATESIDKEGLALLTSDNQRYDEWKHETCPRIVDVLEEFPSIMHAIMHAMLWIV